MQSEKVASHTERKDHIMRTKTMLLSALLGTLGSVSLMAQTTNVYSLNVVGYVNVTIQPGYNIISCPLICSPDNTINTLFPYSSTANYAKWTIYIFQNGVGYSADVTGGKSSWTYGTNTINPGQAAFVYNAGSTAVTNIFVGTVPTGALTNTLVPGYNLVGSILPVSGDLVTNTLSTLTVSQAKDFIYTFNPVTQGYTEILTTKSGSFATDPSLGFAEGMFYYNAQATAENWVENFSVSQ
jgi:hypothetical protein